MNQRDDHTYELISAYLDGELSPDEVARAEQLLAGDVQHRQVLDELRAIGDGMQTLPSYQLGSAFADRVVADVHAASGAEQSHVVSGSSPAVVSRSEQPIHAPGLKRGGWRTTLVAAALLAAAILLVLFAGDFWHAPSTSGQPQVAVGPPAGNSNIDSAAAKVPGPGTADTARAGGNTINGEGNINGEGDINSEGNINSVGDIGQRNAAGRQEITDQPREGAPSHQSNRVEPGRMAQSPGAKDNRASDPRMPGSTEPRSTEPRSTEPRSTEIVSVDELPKVEFNGPQQLLLVIDVAVSSTGLERARFEQALISHGIVFDGTIEADRQLEGSLLASRFIDSPEKEVPKGEVKEDAKVVADEMQLIYAVARGGEVDTLYQAMRADEDNFPAVNLDMALKPADLTVFKHLRRSVETKWPDKNPLTAANTTDGERQQAAYRLLLSPSWRGSPAARLRGAAGLKGLVPDWMVDEASGMTGKSSPKRARRKRVPGGEHTPVIIGQGKEILAEVLFVVHPDGS